MLRQPVSSRQVVARDGTRLAVHDFGAGPPVLCVPGGPGRASAYLECLGGLDRSRTLHLLDLRGTGQSELPSERESLQFPRLADDLEDVRQALDLDPADVIAHSAGCAVALAHAARHPDAVRRLVLVTPSARLVGGNAGDLPAIRSARSGEPWYPEAAEAVELLETASPGLRRELERATRPFWYGRWDERTQAHAESADRQVSLRAAAGFPAGPSYDADAARGSLAAVTAQVLVLVGERDGLTGVMAGDAVARDLPAASVGVLPRAGHFPWVDEPEEFREAVEEFLTS